MAKLMLEGFSVRPIVHVVDVENSTVRAYPMGEQQFNLEELAGFVAERWPDIWTLAVTSYEKTESAAKAQALGEAALTGNRATKRAAAKKGAKVKPDEEVELVTA